MRIEPSKRLFALLIDLIACYILAVLISTFISLIPIVNRVFYLNRLFSQQLCLAILFMCRDYFFKGRGIGKNLMGLQVVSTEDKLPITIRQSMLRNLPLTAPMLFFELTSLVPAGWLPAIILSVFNILETLYAVIVFPLESYRAYSREDSLRLGDVIAHTRLIESQTDFDSPLTEQKVDNI